MIKNNWRNSDPWEDIYINQSNNLWIILNKKREKQLRSILKPLKKLIDIQAEIVCGVDF